MNRCVLIAAGPMQSPDVLKQKLRADDYILCADGGADNARLLGVVPDVVMGDLDSISILPKGVQIERFSPEKDDTDTMLALRHALDLGYHSFLLLGVLGGRADHTFANLCALLYLTNNGADAVIIDGGTEVYAIKNGALHLKRRPNYYISVFPFGQTACGVSEYGMQYTLENARMEQSNPIGVSNEFQDEEAVISVREGTLLIFLCPKK